MSIPLHLPWLPILIAGDVAAIARFNNTCVLKPMRLQQCCFHAVRSGQVMLVALTVSTSSARPSDSTIA